jgi:hypothetical protein
LMREHDLQLQTRRRHVATTDSDHEDLISPAGQPASPTPRHEAALGRSSARRSALRQRGAWTGL